ncbi:MAG: hypothetical protein A4E62_00833 [Syntrophorhabdus sp. PtaU1.Bin002]|nr:MAG: hypothetical protein A4E62_00833 [Syntrophorhabdus sp. PtaU1.Bin002]
MINKLVSHRNQVLFIELAGLLHDVGKLSRAFLEYRQAWQEDPKGYDNDPHDHQYLDRPQSREDAIPSKFDKPIGSLGGFNFYEPDFSIRKAVNFHTSPGDCDLIGYMLNAADSVDSAMDRNNPLWSAEQKEKGIIYCSNVFGHEHSTVCFDDQEGKRRQLYKSLNNELDAYFDDFNHSQRLKVFDHIRDAFKCGLSDTTRPQNDTTLWEHSYAVASILKVIAVYNLLVGTVENWMRSYNNVRFRILGIGWDGIRFMSYGQKIGDVIGRKAVIDSVEESLRTLIEWEYAFGNEIYRDDNGIYFVVPALSLTGDFKGIWQTIEGEIHAKTASESTGELQPHIVIGPETNTLTILSSMIREMAKQIVYCFDSSTPGFRQSLSEISGLLPRPKPICPICRLRPAEKDDAPDKICRTCRKRRQDAGLRSRIRHNETIFISEISDCNSGAALIVAQFGLDRWLDGTMIRSLFVSEPHGLKEEIRSLGTVTQFKDEEMRFKEFFKSHPEYEAFGYERIKADVDSICYGNNQERGDHVAFLYDRRVVRNEDMPAGYSLVRETAKTRDIWCQLHKSLQGERLGLDIYSILNTKTPTPSTILDVWNATEGFFGDMADVVRDSFPEKNRLRLTVNATDLQVSNASFEAGAVFVDESRRSIDILIKGKSEIEVIGEVFPNRLDWRGTVINVTDAHYPENTQRELVVTSVNLGTRYRSCRTVTISPNLFIAIIPQDETINITAKIYAQYLDLFGKVLGRLPFSIGNIFFQETIPMFVALDGAKRMLVNFDELAQAPYVFTVKEKTASIDKGKRKIKVSCELHDLKRNLTWNLPCSLGDGKEDFYHPYLPVSSCTFPLKDRESFFPTGVGDMVHISGLEENDKLSIYPNFYDFEFLDSNSRRHDLRLADGGRKSNVANFRSKPVFLDELTEKIIKLWNGILEGSLLPGVTDTKLRNLQSLWLTKLQEWDVNLEQKDDRAYKTWSNFVRNSLRKEFGIENKDLLEVVDNGLFFDALDLFLGILKERVGTKKGGEQDEQTI